MTYFTKHSGLIASVCLQRQESILSHSGIIFHHVFIPHFLYPVVHWWTSGLIPSLVIMNWTTVNIGVQITLLDMLISFGWIPMSGMAGSYGVFVFRYLRNLHIVLHNGNIGLHSHQQWARVCFSLYSPASSVIWFLDDNHSNRDEVKRHCHFNFHFVLTNEHEDFFMFSSEFLLFSPLLLFHDIVSYVLGFALSLSPNLLLPNTDFVYIVTVV